MDIVTYGIGYPIFYIVLLSLLMTATFRIKRERRLFHVRIEKVTSEWRQAFLFPIVYGVILSIGWGIVGIVFSMQWLYFIGTLMIVTIIVSYRRLLSPAYWIFIVLGALLLLKQIGELPFLTIPSPLSTMAIWGSGIVMTSLLIVEGRLIERQRYVLPSPYVQKTARGLQAARFRQNQLWVVPLFLLVPEGWLGSFASFWPLVAPVGIEQFHFVLFPVVIGHAARIQSSYPDEYVMRLGRRVQILGFFSFVVFVALYFYPKAVIPTLIVIGIARFLITVWTIWEDRQPSYFTKVTEEGGLRIVGILPNTPAVDLGLRTGETIFKVNGETVQNEKQFYEAIQKNAAHCKLEVFDRKGEIRHVQRVLYAGDHYRLGLLFIKE